jgi:hypothetical protein
MFKKYINKELKKRRPGEESDEGEVRSRGEKGELGEEEESRRGGAGARNTRK